MATLTIEISDKIIEDAIKSMMENMPEYSTSMDCLKYKYDLWEYRFQDYEDGKKYDLDKAKLLATFPLMYGDKWPSHLRKPPSDNNKESWDQWLTHADADYVDSFVQLACFGEVIYG